MIDIHYAFFEENISEAIFNKDFEKIPRNFQERNKCFLRIQDRTNNLYGKILLMEALEKYGISGKKCLSKISYEKWGRPILNIKEFDFNISHSHSLVVCVLGRKVRVGIDVELIRHVNFSYYKSVFTEKQFASIRDSSYPMKMFFKYWTAKESVAKADGRGIGLPFKEMCIKEDKVSLKNKMWYVKYFELDEKYIVCLACNEPIDFSMIRLSKKDLYN